MRETIARRLSDPDLAPLVDLVAYPEPGPGLVTAVVVRNSTGAVRLLASGEHELIAGRDPVADTDPLAFLPYERERADPSPPNARNAYPDPARRLLQFFSDADRSPDLAVMHTPGHHFPDEHGHVGEHGSLDVVQSRAPFLVSGAGVPARGAVAGSARTVDVAPTLLHLAGVDPAGLGLDGVARTDLAPVGGARHVIGLLMDGAHCSELLHLAGTGELPAVARLLGRGTALTGGAVAAFPSVTLCNHTCLLTGLHPGRHGILGNVFYDRALGERVNANDETTWHRSAEWLRPGVRTVFELLDDARPGAVSASIDEAIDRGATSSTMQVIRASGGDGAGSLDDVLPPAEDSPWLGSAAHLANDYFRWCSRVDDVGVQQMLDLWPSAGAGPALTWWAQIVTDAGHHAGGPRSDIARDSLRDADRRLGAVLDHLDTLGVFDQCAFLLTADHGFETTDPAVTGSWGPALAEVCADLGVAYRDEGPGFVYLL